MYFLGSAASSSFQRRFGCLTCLVHVDANRPVSLHKNVQLGREYTFWILSPVLSAFQFVEKKRLSVSTCTRNGFAQDIILQRCCLLFCAISYVCFFSLQLLWLVLGSLVLLW